MFTIEVYCDDESHADKRVKIITFEYDDEDGEHFADGGTPEARWGTDFTPTVAQQRRHSEAMKIRAAERDAERDTGAPEVIREARGLQRLREIEESITPSNDPAPPVTFRTVWSDGRVDANMPASRTDAARYGASTEDVAGLEWHMKYHLTCRLCGLDPQVRHDRVVPLLEAMRKADVRAVSLAALAARF